MENNHKRKSHEDYCKILGVAPDASHEEIKEVYRNLAKVYGAGINGNNAAASEKMKEINEAWEHFESRERQRKENEAGTGLPVIVSEYGPEESFSEENRSTRADQGSHSNRNHYERVVKIHRGRKTAITAGVVIVSMFAIAQLVRFTHDMDRTAQAQKRTQETNNHLASQGVIILKKTAADRANSEAQRMTLADLKNAAKQATDSKYNGRAEELVYFKENEKPFYQIKNETYTVSGPIGYKRPVIEDFDRKAIIHYKAAQLNPTETETLVKKANLSITDANAFKVTVEAVYFAPNPNHNDKSAPKPVIYEPDPNRFESGTKKYSDFMHDQEEASNIIIYFGSKGSSRVVLDLSGKVISDNRPKQESLTSSKKERTLQP